MLFTAAEKPLAVPRPRSYGSTDRIPLQKDMATLKIPQIPPRVAAVSQASAQAIIPSTRSAVTVVPPLHQPSAFQPSVRSHLALFFAQFLSNILCSSFLLCVVAWASAVSLYRRVPTWIRPVKPRQLEWDNPQLAKTEKVTKQVQAYAQAIGFNIIDEQVETADGYFLR